MKPTPFLLLCICMLSASCTGDLAHDEYSGPRLWSDKPAFTRVMANQNEHGLSSDIWDGLYEGDAAPSLPRVANPDPHIKRWHTGEGTDYLDEETSAATHGKYPNPIRLWESDAYQIGNGRIGASVFHGSGRDRYALNEVSFWSGGRNGGTINKMGDKSYNGEDGPYSTEEEFGGYQPVGDFIVDFGSPVKEDAFVREIRLAEGELYSRAERNGVRILSKAFCSNPDQVMVLRYEASRKDGLSAVFAFATQRPEDQVTVGDNTITLYCPLRNGIHCMAKATLMPKGGEVSKLDGGLSLDGAKACTIIISIETNYVMDYAAGWRGEDAAPRIESRMAKIERKSFAELQKRHQEDYSALFDRVSLTLPTDGSLEDMPIPERLERYKDCHDDVGLERLLFDYGRYLMISTSRGGCPPGGLQGIWNGMIRAPWGNDYHSNINLQLLYWPAEVTDLPECHMSLLDYLNATREPNRIATREYLEAIGEDPASAGDGWLVYTSHNPFGGHGWQVNLPGSAWYALHMWEHFAFTQDVEWLRKTGYPMLKEISTYWMNHLKVLGERGEGFHSNYQEMDVSQYPELADATGMLVVPEGWSPEHGPRGEDGVAHDQQIVSELFHNTVAAARTLGEDRAWADSLEQICGRLYGPHIGAKGNLMEWMIDRDPETDHRHTSHLFAVYPGKGIGPEKTPELFEAAKKSLEYRRNTGDSRRSWSWTWRCMLWSRLHDGDRAHDMLEGLMTWNMLDNLLTSHKIPQQIDGSYGIAAAMMEMLVQSHEDVIVLLPALPSAWPSGEVKGVKVRGNMKLDMKWKDGMVVKWQLHGAPGTVATVSVNGKTETVTVR